MSTDRPALFQETLHTSTEWIHQLSEATALDEQQTFHILCATLQALRDRLPVNEAVQLAAQLPVLIRGLYYEGWRPADAPKRIRHLDDFLALVAARYHARPLDDLQGSVRATLALLGRRVSLGEVVGVVRVLPEELRVLWPPDILART